MFTEEYIKKCEMLNPLQKSWVPQVGDWVYRKYTMFGKEIDKKIWPDKVQREDLIVLTFESDIEGYFHASDIKGNVRTFKYDEKFFKEICVFVPTIDRLFDILGDERKGYYLINEIENYISTGDGYKEYWKQFSRIELILAFISHKKWKRVWDDKKKKWKRGSF